STRLRFEGLHHGATYHASVLALHAEQLINSQHPTTVTFAFTGDQDVEDTLTRSAKIRLDDRQFSGTIRIPVHALRTKFNNDHRENSTSMKVRLDIVSKVGRWETYTKVFDKTYDRPRRDWYPDYRLVNLSYGVTYRVTLTSSYKKHNGTSI